MASTGEEGYFLLSSQAFDLVILDLMLPGRDGLEILRTVQRHGSTIRTPILSARDTMPDRVNGLELGADDYLVKPDSQRGAAWVVARSCRVICCNRQSSDL